VTNDRDDADASDWLASHFGPGDADGTEAEGLGSGDDTEADDTGALVDNGVSTTRIDLGDSGDGDFDDSGSDVGDSEDGIAQRFAPGSAVQQATQAIPWGQMPRRPVVDPVTRIISPPTVVEPLVAPATELLAAPAAPQAATPVTARPDGGQRASLGRNHKIMLWIAGSVVAVLALVVLFLVGTKLAAAFGPAPVVAALSPSASPSDSPSPTPSASAAPPAVAGPVAAGTYAWDELLGGECLTGYDSPWAEEFTVVDCGEPHPAQLVFRGMFEPTDAGAYPGVEALQARIGLACSAPSVIDYAAAGAYSDIQFAASFPATDAQWNEDRSYFCFVNRSSGDPLQGSVAVPQG
jgi:hypothetical protein